MFLNVTKQKISQFLTGLFSGILAASVIVPVTTTTFASNNDGIITVQYLYDDKEMAIEGAEFSISKVADVIIDNGISYNLSENYENLNIDFSKQMNAKEAETVAQTCYDNYHEVSDKVVTDENGRAKFMNLEDGIYLIWQSNSTGDATKYTQVEPFLTVVPAEKEGEFDRDITVYPKSIVKPEEPTEPDKPSGPRGGGGDGNTPNTPTTTTETTPPPTETVVPPETVTPPEETVPPTDMTTTIRKIITKTGDQPVVLFSMIAMLISIAGLAVLHFSKKEEKNK